MKKNLVVAAVSSILGIGAVQPASAVGLADGIYDMVINNTPYSGGYQFGSDGAWNSSFTFGCVPGTKGCASNALYDDFAASPVNGQYAGNPLDGFQGKVRVSVSGGVITGLGLFEFDTVVGTAGGDFAQYGGSGGFTGSIDGAGNISLTPTGVLATVSGFPALVDEAWNIDNFNGGTMTGTVFAPNPPNNNTTYDTFTTGTATNQAGSINGAAYDGSTAVLVKAGSIGDAWGGFFGAQYFEVWNVSFNAVPVPAAVWLFGSGLLGLTAIARRRRKRGS